MTFREPVFIGGRGNTSGLQDKLPTDHGFKGCIRHLQINDYLYKFAPVPKGDAVKGFDIGTLFLNNFVNFFNESKTFV